MTPTHERNWVVFAPEGDIDITRAEELAASVDLRCNGQCPNMVIDLTNVSFMDSSGLGWLTRTQEHLRSEHGQLRIVLGDGPVNRLFDLTGLLPVFIVHESVDDACQESGGPASRARLTAAG